MIQAGLIGVVSFFILNWINETDVTHGTYRLKTPHRQLIQMHKNVLLTQLYKHKAQLISFYTHNKKGT